MTKAVTERRKFETILITNGLVSEEQLKQVARYAHAVGIDLYEAVLQKKIAPPDAVMMAYAESLGLPFIHFEDISVDEEIVAHIDPMTARQHSLIPVSIDHGYVQLAVTRPIIPDVADELRMIFNLPVRCVLCTPSELSTAITKYYPRGAVRIDRNDPSETPSQLVARQKKQQKVQQKTQKKTPPKEDQPGEPMNAEEVKDRAMKTFAAFNFTVAAVCFASYYLPLSRWIGDGFYTFLLLVIAAGSAAAFAVWRALSR